MTAWTDHVKKMASDLGITYKNAMSDARVKGSFTKAPKQPRAKKAAKPPRAELTDEETKANRASAIERIRAMKAKRLANPPPPRVKKPMSEETKAMLKARRESKKADVAKKFEAFWARQESKPVSEAITESISEMVMGAIPAKKTRKSWKGRPNTAVKPTNIASKMNKPIKPPRRKSKLTPLSEEDMAIAFNLLN